MITNHEILSVKPVEYDELKDKKILDLSISDSTVLLVKKNDKLGIITDGDIRRSVRKIGASGLVTDCINWNPVITDYIDNKLESYKKKAEEFFGKNLNISIIPLYKKDSYSGYILKRYIHIDTSDITVVIMAGGFGKRLGNITKNTPKPMVLLGKKPILHNIIDQFVELGYKNIIITTHFLKDVIVDYFEDGSKFGCKIRYVHEKTPLGTIGGLSLIRNEINSKYIFLCNGDVYHKFELTEMHKFIEKHNKDLVLGTATYNVNIPFGVIEHDENSVVTDLKEKPNYFHSVAAGMYLFRSNLTSFLNGNTEDAPDFIKKLISNNLNVSSFSIINRWLDIGMPDQLDKARKFEADV